uniref:Uncharacterized protein n=1 Tax=Acrobeloides nanus TaxID=290746 RepID=A0A914DTH4_9BILA
MVKVHTLGNSRRFNDNAPEYYPTACCEILHVSHAVYAASSLQIIFTIVVACLYYTLESRNFLNAIEVFRPAVVFIGLVNLIGIFCALIGVLLEREIFVQIQITFLCGLVVICDAIAFCLVFTMAMGKKLTLTEKLPKYLVNGDEFEKILGPFWLYICAILLHMTAASTMCILGINRRYTMYIQQKVAYSQLQTEQPTTITVNREESFIKI